VRTPWLEKYLRLAPKLQAKAAQRGARPRCTMAFDCLAQCGLRDGIAKFGQFCIDHQLAAALRGDVEHGLFFRGAGRLPFGTQIRPVRDLLAFLLGEPIAPAA
jgi:nitronate monooxygenase